MIEEAEKPAEVEKSAEVILDAVAVSLTQGDSSLGDTERRKRTKNEMEAEVKEEMLEKTKPAEAETMETEEAPTEMTKMPKQKQ